MKTKQRYFSRQLRQLRFLSKKLNRLVKTGKFYQLSISQQQKLLQKFKKLIHNLEGVFSATFLQKVTAGVALVFGLGVGTPHVQAQTFAEPVINPFGFVPHVAGTEDFLFESIVDLDGDGDLDLVTIAGFFEDSTSIVFYENIGTATQPAFDAASTQENPFGLENLSYLTTLDFVDIDNDGDQDLFSGGYDEVGDYGAVLFYENTGTATTPSFAPAVTNPMGLLAIYYALPVFADIDDDGDQDALVVGYYGSMAFQENIGTPEQANFAPPRIDPFGINFLVSEDPELAFHQVADFDRDGDLDLLFSAYNVDSNGEAFIKPYYQENIGTAENPSFSEAVLNPFGLVNLPTYGLPAVADMDNDGDEDILISGPYGAMHYYENTTVMSNVTDFLAGTHIAISPNPVINHMQLDAEFSDGISEVFMTVTNTLGQVVKRKNITLEGGQIQENWDVSDWQVGLYFVQFQSEGRSRILRVTKQ